MTNYSVLLPMTTTQKHLILFQFILTIALLWSEITILPAQAAICIQYPDPMHTNKSVQRICPDVENQATQSNATQSIQKPAVEPFVFDLSCWADPTICALVKKTCKRAGDIIARTIDIVEPIHVQLQYIPFCLAYRICPQTIENEVIIGRARPAVTHLMVDTLDKNRVREYPQALLKQLNNLSPHPEYTGADIVAMLNAEVNWYFDEEEDNPIHGDQISFLLTLLHEYIHGLGLVSGYSDDMYLHFKQVDQSLPPFLTPTRYIPQDANPAYVSAPNLMAPQGFWGFFENAFDKYFYYRAVNNELVRMSRVTDYYNEFYDGNTLFASALDFMVAWLRSPQATIAIALEKASVTPNTFYLALGADTSDTDSLAITLYTSSSRYLAGTSISHFDTDTYKFSPDFLMIPTAEMNGMTLMSIVERNNGGNRNADPIGPQLLRFLIALGYSSPSVRNNRDASADLEIYHPPSSLVGTPGNPTPDFVSLNASFSK